eukprot:61248-Pyramimonas_sp.AAC.1
MANDALHKIEPMMYTRGEFMTRANQLKEKEMQQQDLVPTTLQQKLVESLASHVPEAKAAHAWQEPMKQDQDDEAQDWKWGETQDERDEQWDEAQDEKWDEQRGKAQDD